MPIMFNTILREEKVSPAEVLLVRHRDNKAERGRTPYDLWMKTADPSFDLYQSHQGVNARQKFAKGPYWASFVGTPDGETLFVGLYKVNRRGLLKRDTLMPHRDAVDKAGSCDVYDLVLQDALSGFIGKLFVVWGPGFRAWVQRADRKDKEIKELRTEFKEPDFPGFSNFIRPFSEIAKLPKGWIEALKSSGGVYLLTCPRTKEQYVGSATGEGGFWGRWQDYLPNMHGGNVTLKSRNPSDYQVSILEVAGSAHRREDILNIEELWKKKLKSKKMGLNR